MRELSLGERMKMELIAALLHQPQLLLLDEPTIGLDVVAQVTIQKCLREYNEVRGVTMLLTSHYMRDVEALCRRVLVITHGKLVYDGPLAGITEQFGSTKLVKLQFEGDRQPGRPGGVRRSRQPGGPDRRTERRTQPGAGSAGRDSRQHTVVDMSVHDPPLDQMIAKVFERGATEAAKADG